MTLNASYRNAGPASYSIVVPIPERPTLKTFRESVAKLLDLVPTNVAAGAHVRVAFDQISAHWQEDAR